MDNKEIVEDFVRKNTSLLIVVAYLFVLLLVDLVWFDLLFPLVTLSNVLAMMCYKRPPPLLRNLILVNCAISTVILISEHPSVILYFIQIYSTLELMREGEKV